MRTAALMPVPYLTNRHGFVIQLLALIKINLITFNRLFFAP